MKLQITSRKFKVKDSLKEFIEKRINGLERYNDEILDVDVVLSFTHPKDSIKTVDITALLPGKTIKVSESSEDFQKSVSQAVDKLERQVKKIKTKKITIKRAQ